MSTLNDPRINNLVDYLVQSADQSGQLQTVLERTIQALNKRGIQISVDFNGMIRTLRSNLENAHKSSQFVLRQLNQLQELVHTSALITSSLEFDQVLAEVMDTVIKLTGAERAYLMLIQPDSDDFTIQVARNAQGESLSKDDVTFSKGIIQTAIGQGTPIVTTNAQDDERFAGMKSVFTNELRSVIIVPLILKGKPVGALYADNRIEQGVFSQDNVPILSAFANQAAIAISNARLFEKIKDDLKAAQQQVQMLLIEIDQTRIQEKVSEITESDYFKELSAKAKDMRQRTKKE